MKTREHLILFPVAVIFSAAIIAIALFAPAEKAPDRVTDMYTLGAMSDVPPETDMLGPPDGDLIFRVNDIETLDLLIAADAFGEFRALNGIDPVIVMEGDMLLDHDIVLEDGMRLIMTGRLSGGGRICIYSDSECEISISSNENISRFVIDAPLATLTYTGGDVPFLREIAYGHNVAVFNGSPLAGAADGDTLGGPGHCALDDVILYTGSKRTDEWDGSYSVVNGNLVTLYVPHDVSDRDMRSLYIGVDARGGSYISDGGAVDLSSPKLIDIADENGRTRTYRLSAERARLDIPVLSIYTDDGSDIDSKEFYKTGRMELDGETYTLSVKGRGNASWNTFPKHSYRLKLDSKAKLCSMTANRDWVLIGNYVDPSLLRNKVASDMTRIMDGLPFTPEQHSVDLFINGEYMGVFLLSEKIENDKGRVPLGERITDDDGKIVDMGFLIEFGWDYASENVYGKDYFDTSYCKRMYIKEPEIAKAKNDEYQYVYNYVKAAENAIVKGSGYEDYIDVDSWVDWFIVNELSYNAECAFYRSLYMYKPVGGKLTAGPIWDYDMAFGNNLIDKSDYTGWCAVDYVNQYMYDNWMKFLTKDEAFMSRVRARWAEMKERLRDTALSSLKESAAEIERSQEYNFAIWPKVLKYQIGMSRASTLGLKTWRAHVDYIAEFIDMRYAWMDNALS